MKIFNPEKYARLITHLSLIGLLFAASACNLANLASGKNTSVSNAENQTLNSSASAESSLSNQNLAENAENSATEVQGTYTLDNYREGEEGYKNSLTVEQTGKGKIHVSFEGTFLFQANGAETFHDTAAKGNLQISGNTASGKLIEEGSENGCTVQLNFSAERVNLKSSNCELNVTPDGVYRKGSGDSNGSALKEKQRKNSGADAPFIQYDQNGEPNGIVNLMQREGERTGCEDEILTFDGKVMNVETAGDFVFEFTLVNGSRKRQKISLALSAGDKLPYDDVRSIIKVGNNLEVRYILCGNAGIATPTEIYKQ